MKQLFIGLLIALLPASSMAQGQLIPAGGIQIMSGSKILYQHPTLLAGQCLAFYKNYKPQIQKIVEDAIVNNVHNSTGEHVRELQVRLTDDISFEADNGHEPGDFTFVMNMKGNNANFKVTTPGILGSYADPRFDFTWDALFFMSFRDVRNPQTFICENARMQVMAYTIKADNTPASLVMLCNKVYSAFSNEKGFFPDMRKSSANMAGVLNRDLVAAIQPLLKEAFLAEEFRIDGNDSLHCTIDVNNGNLIVRHPHTIIGSALRRNQQSLQNEVVSPQVQRLVNKPALKPKTLAEAVNGTKQHNTATSPVLKDKPVSPQPKPRLNPQPLPPGNDPPRSKGNTLNPKPLPPGSNSIKPEPKKQAVRRVTILRK